MAQKPKMGVTQVLLRVHQKATTAYSEHAFVVCHYVLVDQELVDHVVVYPNQGKGGGQNCQNMETKMQRQFYVHGVHWLHAVAMLATQRVLHVELGLGFLLCQKKCA